MILEAKTRQLASARNWRRRCRAALYIEEDILLQPDILPRIARFLGVDSPDDGGLRLCTNNTASMSIFLRFLQSRECLSSCQVAAVFLHRYQSNIDMEVLGNPAFIKIPWKMFVLAEKVTGNSNKDFVLIDSSEMRQGKTGLTPDHPVRQAVRRVILYLSRLLRKSTMTISLFFANHNRHGKFRGKG